MASKVTPYFILTAEGCMGTNEPQNVCDVTTEETAEEKSNTEIVKYKKNPTVTTLTRKELTRKRMEFIQQKLEESRARHAEKQKTLSINLRPIPRVGDSFMPRTPHTYVIPDTSHKPQQESPPRKVEMVPLSVSRKSPTNGDMPYVYFVVSVDRLQRSKTDLSLSSYESLESSVSGNSSVKKKNKLLSRNQRRKKKQDDNYSTVSKSDGNFSSGKKQIFSRKQIPFCYNSSPVIPPPTPATVTTYNMQDRAEDDCQTERHLSVGDLRDFNENRTVLAGKASPPRLIELPYISADLQRKNLGSSNSSMEGKAMEVYRKALASESGKKVHFAEGFDLPSIRGGAMGIPRGLMPNFGNRPNTMPTIMSERDDFDRYVNTAIPKTAFGTPRSQKPGQPLNLPKIDIVSGVYDELIVKAIEAYINEFPPNSKQGRVARQLLQQLHERSITTNDLANMERRPRGHGLKIKELEPDTSRGNEMPISKTSRGQRRPVKPKADGEFSTLAPTCFQMVAPGAQSARDEVTVVSLK